MADPSGDGGARIGGIIGGDWSDAMIGVPELAAKLAAEDLEQARRMTGVQKLRAGGDLFDEACRWTLAGIRGENPGISEEDALKELRRRVEQGESTEPPA